MTDARTRLLLVSSSTVHGRGYLDHVADALPAFLAGVKSVAFVPYALADRDGYAAKARERFGALGIELLSVHQAPDPRAAVRGRRPFGEGDGRAPQLGVVTGVEPDQQVVVRSATVEHRGNGHRHMLGHR